MTRSTTYLLGCPTKRQPLFLNRIPNNPIQRGRPLSVLAISILLVALIALPGIACADDFVGGIPLSTVQTGTVTGDLWFNATPAPDWGSLDVTKTFTLPENTVGNITWARLYISAYDGHMQDDKAFTITNKFDGNGDGTYEQVWPETGHASFNYVTDNNIESPTYGELLGNDNTALGGGAHDRYRMINDHENRVTSDYFMWYDVTNLISSRAVNVNVDTTGSYDGRIKVITLVVAYNDPTSATLTTYYVNQGHDVCSYYTENQGGADDGTPHVAVGSTTFATTGLSGISSATLTVDYMASNNGNYGFPTAQNNFDPSTKTGDFTNINLDRTADVQGAYSGLDHWDVTSSISGSSTTTFGYARYLPGSGTAAFYKIPLAFLVVKSPIPAVTPVAAFTANITSGTAPLTVAFTDESTNTPTGWAWMFGDGSTSTEQSPVHEYTAAGTYTVTLTATNAGGSNTATQTNYIAVTAAVVAPVANFTATPTSGAAPLTVQFTDASTNTPTSWAWTFGDGVTSTTQNPSHEYTAAGTYTVTLTATNSAGYDIEEKTGYITVSAAPVTNTVNLSADADSYIRWGTAYENSNFGTSSVINARIEALEGSYWGRSLIHFDLSSIPEGATIESSTLHAYKSAYTLTPDVYAYRITNPWTETGVTWNNWDSNASIAAGPSAVATTTAAKEWVSWDVTNDVQAYASGTAPNYGWMLNLTDTTRPSSTIKATFNSRENTVNPPYLIVTYHTTSGTITPTAAFSANTTNGIAPLTVQFTDASANVPTSWSWDFGDGNTTNATEQNPVHTYAAAGNYTVKLTAANSAGSNTKTETDYITVIPLGVIALPGQTNPPTDPNGDGLYEDLNGNGHKDFNDVYQFFTQMSWIRENEPLSLFDFNANSHIDFNDIYMLYHEIVG